jgi:hypothetical protein
MGTPKEGGNPLNIDPETWRVAPDQSRFGSGFKKPESQGFPGAKTPDVSAPAGREGDPTVNIPAEQRARRQLSKPPPEEQAEQKEKERLQKLLASSLSEIVEDKSEERFSEKWYLSRKLSPYLDEYPFLAEDIPTLTELRDFLNTPQAPAINYALGVFDAWDPDIDQRIDRQIRQILSEAQRRHS